MNLGDSQEFINYEGLIIFQDVQGNKLKKTNTLNRKSWPIFKNNKGNYLEKIIVGYNKHFSLIISVIPRPIIETRSIPTFLRIQDKNLREFHCN